MYTFNAMVWNDDCEWWTSGSQHPERGNHWEDARRIPPAAGTYSGPHLLAGEGTPISNFFSWWCLQIRGSENTLHLCVEQAVNYWKNASEKLLDSWTRLTTFRRRLGVIFRMNSTTFPFGIKNSSGEFRSAEVLVWPAVVWAHSRY